MEAIKIYLGTELKLNINIDAMGEFTMDDYDWQCDVYCSAQKVLSIPKSSAIRIDSNNYIILVDSVKIGTGNVKCKVIAHIPDEDFPDGLRTEVIVMDAGINIIKTQ
jgi:hypothetical protein